MAKKYDGTVKSLANKSRRPHSHPNEHTKDEIKLLRKKYQYHKYEGLGQVYRKCLDSGYKRSYGSMCKQIKKFKNYEKPKKISYPKSKYKPLRRKSPFFMNAGLYNSGSQLKKIGEFYAKAIKENFGLEFDAIFGPAYKGIPLSVVTSVALYDLYGKEVVYSSNRKEIKDHGDTGIFLGDKLNSKMKVLIIEDVTTSGKSIEETYPIITQNKNIEVIGLIVSLK